jgi:hypothetical protein
MVNYLGSASVARYGGLVWGKVSKQWAAAVHCGL